MTRCDGYAGYISEDLGEAKLIQFLSCESLFSHTLARRLLIVPSRNLLGFVQL